MKILPSCAAIASIAVILSACTSVSSNITPEMQKAQRDRIYVCHGFNCTFRTRVDVTEADAGAYASYFSGAQTPQDERAAIARAVSYFEERSADTIGIRDGPKSSLAESGQRGQMDCIDESTNTRSLLLHLAAHGHLKHHDVQMNVSRGFLLDARYFHSTSVVKDKSGQRWAVDSWYDPAGGTPDIMPLEEWMTRGVMGAR